LPRCRRLPDAIFIYFPFFLQALSDCDAEFLVISFWGRIVMESQVTEAKIWNICYEYALAMVLSSVSDKSFNTNPQLL